MFEGKFLGNRLTKNRSYKQAEFFARVFVFLSKKEQII